MGIVKKMLLLILVMSLSISFCACNSKNKKEKAGGIVWDGESVVIYDDKDVQIKLFASMQDANIVAEGRYTVEAYNKSKSEKNYKVYIRGINNKVNCNESSALMGMKPKKKMTATLDCSSDIQLSRLDEVKCLKLEIGLNNYVEKKDGGVDWEFKKLKDVQLTISNIVRSQKRYKPYREMYADKQTLIENKSIKMMINAVGTLTSTNDYSKGESAIWYSVENLTDKQLTFACDAICINGITFDNIGSKDLIGKAKYYDSIKFSESELDDYGIKSINSLKLHISNQKWFIYSEDVSVFGEDKVYDEAHEYTGWYDINLKNKGKNTVRTEKEKQLLYEKDGLHIAYTKTIQPSGYDDVTHYWRFNVTNDTNHNIHIAVSKCKGNAKSNLGDNVRRFLSGYYVGKKQKRTSELELNGKEYTKKMPTEIKIQFFITDADTEEVLGKTNIETVKINLEKENDYEETTK